jgi:hypothetical protein
MTLFTLRINFMACLKLMILFVNLYYVFLVPFVGFFVLIVYMCLNVG